QFFGWLAAQMTRTTTPPTAPAHATPPTAPTVSAAAVAAATVAGSAALPTATAAETATTDDPLTVLAALVYAARPLSADDLVTALGWPRERVAACLGVGRLTPAQRAALRPHRRPQDREPGFTSAGSNAE